MKNPPNFRRSALFSDIKMQTFDYYDMQKLETYENLFVQTNEVAMITDYQLLQSTTLLGLDATYTLTFTPKNPLSNDGMMSLSWTDQVVFLEDDFKCTIDTY